MAIKPLVLVFQELRQPSATIISPTLTGCVIGPHYHVKTYDEHHDEVFAGKYDVATGVTISALPAAVPGMKLKADGFKLYMDHCRVVIDGGTAGAITIGGELTGDTLANFLTTKVKVGDTLKLTHTTALTGVASVVVLTNAYRINLASLPVDFLAVNEFAVGDIATVGAITGAITAVNAAYIDIATPFIANATAANLSVVRKRIIRDLGNQQTYAVKAVSATSVRTVQLTTNFPFAATGVAYEFSRRLTKAEISVASYTLNLVGNSVVVAAGATTTVDSLLRTVTEYDLDPSLALEDQALIYTEYTALDVSYAHIPASIGQASEITSQLGIADARNPLGLGATVMFGNSLATIRAIGLESEDLIGWVKAIDAVNRGGFYAQALLTQDPAIIGVFKANNVANEVPEKARYGMCIGNHSLPLSVQPAGSSAGAQIQDPGTLLYTIFDDVTANFADTALPVSPGDKLTISGVVHIVDVVVNANRLKVVAGDAFVGTATGVTYTITRDLTKNQQAASLAATSTALKNKRCVMTMPDLCEIAGAEAPGYYLNCVVAGMICGLPSQAGITNKGAAVISKVKHTNWDYFTEVQIDVIAAGGTLVFAQEDPNSLPFVRHQLTTDIGLLETAEVSVVKNNDFLSLFFKGIVKSYLGEWNVTDDLLSALRIAISQGILFQKGNKVAKIGAPLIDATIELLEKSEISPDRVEIKLSTTQPKPLNTLGLHMIL